eukprot:scaffold25009_cov71-Cyclotella_meneghiniana.AAC.2
MECPTFPGYVPGTAGITNNRVYLEIEAFVLQLPNNHHDSILLTKSVIQSIWRDSNKEHHNGGCLILVKRNG